MDILKKHSDKIDWGYLSANTHPEAIRMLEENPDEIEWMFLSGNPAARELLLANLDKIDWDEFCGNPAMIDVILARARNADGEWALCWETLSSNPAAIQWMLQHQEEQGVYFDTDGLATNTAPEAIALIEQQLRQIGLDFVAPRYRELLSRNPAAIRLFESAGMVVPSLFENPAIFVYDYKKMEENRREFHEELIAAVYHPRRVARRLEMGADWEEFDLEDM
jgi:hypothetical protein